MFKVTPAYFVDFVVCVCCDMLLTSLRYGLLGCEFSEFSFFKSNMHVLLFGDFPLLALLLISIQCG